MLLTKKAARNLETLLPATPAGWCCGSKTFYTARRSHLSRGTLQAWPSPDLLEFPKVRVTVKMPLLETKEELNLIGIPAVRQTA